MPHVRPSSPEASRRMANVRQKRACAEIALRRELYRKGLRYRVAFKALKKPHRAADIDFSGRMNAIFVDGCFWYECQEHATWPTQNPDFWRKKIKANRTRDFDMAERLRSVGWTLPRFWEHEPPTDSADIVVQTVAMGESKVGASSPAHT